MIGKIVDFAAGMGPVELGTLTLCGVVVAWGVRRLIRGSRPSEVVFLREKPLFTRSPFPLAGRPDLVVERRDGSLKVKDLKNRKRARIYPADVVQLSCYALLLRELYPSRKVANEASVVVRTKDCREREESVRLMGREELVALRERWLDVVEEREPPRKCDGRLCGHCSFKGRLCDGA